MLIDSARIRQNAISFVEKWHDESSEDAEAKSFLDDFFAVFGIARRRVATFEHKVKKLGWKDGFIDLLWKGKILIEMKSRGRDLTKASRQAKDYFPGLTDTELPKYILVSDFVHFSLENLDTGEKHDFDLAEFPEKLDLFDFLHRQQREYTEQSDVDRKAIEAISPLADRFHELAYDEHATRVFLVRILFLLFSEDAGIFEGRLFGEWLKEHTRSDGSDIGAQLSYLFEILNTPTDKRPKNLPGLLAQFPYVNGGLFAERLPTLQADSAIRDRILHASQTTNWSTIHPAIFGALFQGVMDQKLRRTLWAHYTSEKNIHRAIDPLFLDGLWDEFTDAQFSPQKLRALRKKIAGIKVLDPACGCGNFLVVAYKELRTLEIEIVKKLRSLKGDNTLALDMQEEKDFSHLKLSNFCGIEIDEFPAKIAQTAMWLVDHQMNRALGDVLGIPYVRLPLNESANIVNANALRTDWAATFGEVDYIVGNPPFLGAAMKSKEQVADMIDLTADGEIWKLDFVAAWYIKGAEYLEKYPSSKVAFVSTNSITQGEQVAILWERVLKNGTSILFAHRTFQWSNDAKGVAAVHCVIIGFGRGNTKKKYLFQYTNLKDEPIKTEVKNINAYLVEASDVTLESRREPISQIPEIKFGSMANDRPLSP